MILMTGFGYDPGHSICQSQAERAAPQSGFVQTVSTRSIDRRAQDGARSDAQKFDPSAQ